MDLVNDPGAVAAAERAAPHIENPATLHHTAGGRLLRLGVASWTDKTLTAANVFYPLNAKSAQERLQFYASLFPMVEVDSSYYALPSRNVAELWVERTPENFVFDIKAFALMTGHPAEVSRLPAEIADALPKAAREKGRIYARDIPDEIIDAVWSHFAKAVSPLANAGKLGAIFLQYPKWFLASADSARELKRARARLGALPAAVEFRNARWLAPRLAERTFDMLRDLDFSYVCVDEPQGLPSSVPPVLKVTNARLAVIRLHGQRSESWEKRGASVHERFRYLYTQSELSEWAPKVLQLANEANETHVVFNNCWSNYGTTNALELGALLARA